MHCVTDRYLVLNCFYANIIIARVATRSAINQFQVKFKFYPELTMIVKSNQINKGSVDDKNTSTCHFLWKCLLSTTNWYENWFELPKSLFSENPTKIFHILSMWASNFRGSVSSSGEILEHVYYSCLGMKPVTENGVCLQRKSPK